MQTSGYDRRPAIAPKPTGSGIGDLKPREERLNSLVSARSPLPMTVWRSATARRYIFVIRSVNEPIEAGDIEAVLIAACRKADGSSAVISTGVIESDPTALRGWCAKVRAAGADEIHFHRLAPGPDARVAVALDLSPQAEMIATRDLPIAA